MKWKKQVVVLNRFTISQVEKRFNVYFIFGDSCEGLLCHDIIEVVH